MKKYLLFFVFLTALVMQGRAQIIINESFDTYTAGSKLAQQAGAPWTTWSSAPGGTEDPNVSSTQSSSPSNSVYIGTSANDLVVDFGDKTTGRYKISFEVFVETGKVGYFNILNDFAGTNSVWAMQAYLRTNGYISADAGAAKVDSLPYTINAWNDIVFIVDIDDDFATMYVNGTELVSWTFSGGSFGTGSTHKLDAMNFYGWVDGTTQPGMYIDNFLFEQVTVPEAPINLTAVLTGGDVALNWTAPSGTPDGYTIVRNTVVIASGLSSTTYDDNGLYPMAYNYAAKAHYDGLGYSHSSNDTTVTVAGAIARNLVLFEYTTSVMCYYCPGAALGALDLVSNGKQVAIIKYHNDWQGADPYTIPEGEARGGTYYSNYVTGNPTAIADGTIAMVGGNHTTSLYPNYLTMYNTRMAKSSIHDIDMEIVKTGTDSYTATITVVQTNNYYPSNLYLRTALTESEIAYSWQGQTELHYVCRDMYPDDDGYALDFSSDDTLVFNVNFSTAGFVADNCEFVAFVQCDANQDVTQAAMVDIATVAGIQEQPVSTWNIYPNPAHDQISISGMEKARYEIVTINGQLVMTGMIENGFETINTSSLKQGSYFVRIVGNEVVVKPLVIE